MASSNSIEFIFSTIYANNSWGCKESRSGPAASLDRTASLRAALPEIFSQLKIQSILDCGCGDWNWMKTVDLSGIKYIGCDIVPELIEQLQLNYSSSSVNFQVLNILHDPPDTADLWLARDLVCLFSNKDIWTFFQKFIESGSNYLAITSIDENEPYQDTFTGAWTPLNLLTDPFNMPEPVMRIEDGDQWFMKKWILVYEKEQIQEWFHTKATRFDMMGTTITTSVEVNNDRNAHLTNNIPLRKMKLYGQPGV